jgi:hypothetical protein
MLYAATKRTERLVPSLQQNRFSVVIKKLLLTLSKRSHVDGHSIDRSTPMHS